MEIGYIMSVSSPWNTFHECCWAFIGNPVDETFRHIYWREFERMFAANEMGESWNEIKLRYIEVLGQKLTDADIRLAEAQAWVAVVLLASQMELGPGRLPTVWTLHSDVEEVIYGQRVRIVVGLRGALIKWGGALVLAPKHLVPLMEAAATPATPT